MPLLRESSFPQNLELDHSHQKGLLREGNEAFCWEKAKGETRFGIRELHIGCRFYALITPISFLQNAIFTKLIVFIKIIYQIKYFKKY